MEVMAKPSREILMFTKQIRHWIVGAETISGKQRFIFHEATPSEILELYQSIQSKLSFAYEERLGKN